METEMKYVEGEIVEFSWGYEQTNIDYFLILKRTKTMVTLVEIGKKNVEATGWLVGTCEPDSTKVIGKPFRRKVYMGGGEERGIAIKSYGWATLYKGNGSHWTAYH